LQRLVPGAAVPTALPPAGRLAPGAGTAAGGGQYPACPPAARGPDAGAAPPRPATGEIACELRGAAGAAALGRGARDLHSPGELGRDGHAAESIVPSGEEA